MKKLGDRREMTNFLCRFNGKIKATQLETSTSYTTDVRRVVRATRYYPGKELARNKVAKCWDVASSKVLLEWPDEVFEFIEHPKESWVFSIFWLISTYQ